MLVDAVRLVALPAERQAIELTGTHVPDEVALVYDDSYVLVPQLTAAGLVSATQSAALDELDRHFSAMTNAFDKDEVWSLEAMRTDERWHEARRLAAEALRLLNA
jgi:hypothetical protein